MSFDNENYSKDLAERCLNPFRAGRCLSTEELKKHLAVLTRLNPFRAGRCLSTLDIGKQLKTKRSLNPFRAGRCLSTELKSLWNEYARSQSLSSRAMSFDCSGMLEAGIMRPFRPTSQFFWKVKELALDLSK